MKRRHLAITLSLVIAAAAISPAGAVDAPPGSRNFTSPGSVPDHFSNEAAPFVASPNPHPAPAEPAPAAATPAPAAAAPAPERATPLVVSPYARSHPVRTVTTVRTSRDRQGRTVRAVTVRRYAMSASAARARAPVRAAHAARAVKSKSAAAKVRPVSAGSRRAGRG
jgi:hypothetical protein